MLYVSHIRLRNWRNFQAVDVNLDERIFIVGPNASGKSNLLDAFRFMRDIAKAGGGLQQAVDDRGGISRIRCLAARRYPDIELEVHITDSNSATLEPRWKYSVSLRQETRGARRTLIRHERVWRDSQLLLDRPDNDDKQDEDRLTQTHLEQISANTQFRDIARFLGAIQYVHLVPQLLRFPEAFVGPSLPGDPFGRTFLDRMAQIPEKTRNSRLRRIEEALKIAVPQLTQLAYSKDERGVPHLEAIYQHWRPSGARQREDQFSDGTLRLIALLWSLLDGDAVLLLEEPELSLNNAIVRQLAPIIHRLQHRRRQVIVTTHSPELLTDKGIDGREVLLLKPGVEGTKVSVAASLPQIRELLESGLSIADAVLPLAEPEDAIQFALQFEHP